MPVQGRKLAAIMFTDIVGYSSIMQKDEDRGRLVRERHKRVFEQCTQRYQGEIIQYYGDGTLSAFQSAVAAVECAVKLQQELRTYPQVPLRIGIHLGDIHYDDTEVYGHGVNIAARLEPLCTPGGIFLSGKVYDEIRNHTWLKASSLGVYRFKNIDEPVELFAVQDKGVAFPTDQEVAQIEARSQRMEVSGISERSEAIQKFLNREKSSRRAGRLRKILAGVGLLLLLLLVARLAGVETFVTMTDKGTSIAVLPFSNMSQTQENEYFSDGMTEDILTLLSKIEGFSVTSRTSVMQYKNTTKKIPQIAEELGVDHILEGSVRREGDQVRIVAQLIDARADRHVWAHTYDEQIVNIFDVQSQVASDIARQLRVHLSPEEKRRMTAQQATNSVAYDLYLRGREYYRKYTPDANEQAIALFRRALDIDPDYALAMAGLGDAYAQKAIYTGEMGPILDSAVLMSSRAIETDPNLSEGYKALGLAFHYQNKIPQAITQYTRALKLDPYNDMAASNLGQIERHRGNFVSAAKWAKTTLDMNKTVPSSSAMMAEIYLVLGDTEKAKQVVDEGLKINPRAQDLLLEKAGILQREGMLREAEGVLVALVSQRPDWVPAQEWLGMIYMDEGNWQKAEEHYARALESMPDTQNVKTALLRALHTLVAAQNSAPDQKKEMLTALIDEIYAFEAREPDAGQWPPLVRAAAYGQMGDGASAVAEMEEVIDRNFYDYRFVRGNKIYAPLQSSADFRNVVGKMQHRADSVLAAIRTELQAGT